MADRSVSVFLRANVSGYLASVEKAKLATRDFARDASKSAKDHQQSWDRAGKGFLLTGGLIAAGLGLAVKAAMDFQAQMAQVKSLSGATASEMKKLEQAAKTTGQAFGISAKEAADAETELVKAGISVKDILGGGLKGALILAADGQMNVADATTIAASAMTQFGLKGKDVPHIADLLAAGADKALGSVGDLGSALSSSGTVAAQFGFSLEETVGTLSEFAQNAQIGEKGGTLLRQMLLQLVNPSKQAKDIMTQYGLSISDANGNMVDSSTLAGRLHDSFAGLTPAVRNHALAVIFGAHAIQGANILVKDGAAVNAQWVKSVNDQGFAAKQAAGKMDSLAGDLKKLEASFQTALIDTGEQATGTLRGLTKGLTGVVNAFDDLSPFAKTIIVDLGGVLAVTTLVGGAALFAVPKVVAFRAALQELGITAKTTAVSLGEEAAASNAAGGGGKLAALKGLGAVDAVVTVGMIGKSAIDSSVRGRIQGRTDDLAGDPQKLAAAKVQLAGLAAQIKAVRDAQKGLPGAAGAARGANSGLDVLIGKYDELSTVVNGATAAAKGNAAANGPEATALAKVQKAAADAAADVQQFDDAIKRLSGVFDVRTQTDAMTEGFRALAAQAKKTGNAVHGNSDAAIANRTALTQQYQAALGIIQTYKDQGHGAEAVKAKTSQVTQQFIDQARKAGFTKSQIQNYIDALHKVPANVPTKVTLSGAKAAASDLAALNRQLDHFTANNAVTVGVVNKRRAQADGGYITGPGTKTSDSIPAMLSNGEYVIRASAVDRIGVANLDALNHFGQGGLATKFAANGRRAYATGGLVGDANLSAIQSLLSGTVTTRDDVSGARARQARATAALLAAETALRKLRKDHAPASQIHAEEQRILADRLALTSATTKLRAVNAAYAAGQKPLATRFAAAVASTVRTDAAFIANLNKLTARGFGALAQELLAQGDADARTIAAQEVKMGDATLRAVQNNLVTSSQQARQLASMFGGGGGPSVVQGQGPMVIYVQNPFTGDYLLAKSGAIASQQLTSAARSIAQRPR